MSREEGEEVPNAVVLHVCKPRPLPAGPRSWEDSITERSISLSPGDVGDGQLLDEPPPPIPLRTDTAR